MFLEIVLPAVLEDPEYNFFPHLTMVRRLFRLFDKFDDHQKFWWWGTQFGKSDLGLLGKGHLTVSICTS